MNSKKKYFSYIRVSTARQGQNGTSLIEQRAAITRYSQRYGLTVVKEFEEKETAAKRGRPVFLSMIRELKRDLASGVIIHKIDRSARNLKDWAELGELIDKGLEVHFANENLDLYSRGGRLSADIQAVVAADYIRNLREEVKKGFYGRLKQGFYPMRAPVGYLDKGAGQAKEIDPVKAPLIRKAFELYSTGNYSLRALREKMNRIGLTNTNNKPISINSLADILHNPFYFGTIRLKISKELYSGKHLPIISRKLFEEVQGIFQGKLVSQAYGDKGLENVFLFRKMITCDLCKNRLTVERHKDHRYYSCYTRDCEQKTVREELIETAFQNMLKRIQFNESELKEAEQWFTHHHKTAAENTENARKIVTLQLQQTQERLSKLTDALIDGLIEKELFVQKKNSLILAEGELKDKLSRISGSEQEALQKTEQFIKSINSAHLSYKKTSFEHKRAMIQTVTSNLFVNGKSLKIKLNLPFELLLTRQPVLSGAPERDKVRTLSAIFSRLLEYFRSNLESDDADILDTGSVAE